MGRLRASLLSFVLASAAALALVSCGSGSSAELLPGATASQINSNLDQVQQLVNEGECIGAENAATEVGVQIDELKGVDKELKAALSEGAERLNEVVADCEEAEEEVTETIEEAEEPAETEKKQKPEKEKGKPEKEVKEPPAETTEPPAQEEEVPPAETGGSGSGGVGPAAPVEGE